MFRRVLIANRAEIALRVVRTCRELGIQTVVVHSTADRDSTAVRLADRSVQIGPSEARRSYLNIPAIIEVALHHEVDAIHPGYGFLSEDYDFAEICQANGITFIGPSANVMRKFQDKASARALMADVGLPILPGSSGTVDSALEARRVADSIGFPVIIKAAAGGGGRGMTVVFDQRELSAVYERTRTHAQAVLGDGRVYIERFLEGARHIEVQVLADRQGNVVQLGERDCSMQRRYQKLVEETPAPNLPTGLLGRIRDAAVQGATAVGYSGVGTFEFMLDQRNQFHFIEVNCRLQVEHPVTEMVTGVDLVREQISVAAGNPLGMRQQDLQPCGCAMECRVNTEDPDRNFRPTPGVITRFRPPGGPFTRIDTHGFEGWRVPPDYDSLLAKVIVWARTRDEVLARMQRALSEFEITGDGVVTTVGFLQEALAHTWFREAKHTAAFVDELMTQRRHR